MKNLLFESFVFGNFAFLRRIMVNYRIILRAKALPPRADKGIYDGKGLMFGNKPTFSEKKTKKVWKPNVQRKTYYSEILEEKLKYEMTTSAMRSIDRAGGFDNYIMGCSAKRLSTKAAIDLKKRMLQVLEMKERGDSIEDIREKLAPPPKVSKHQHIPKKYTNRFYFEWKGRKHVVYC